VSEWKRLDQRVRARRAANRSSAFEISDIDRVLATPRAVLKS